VTRWLSPLELRAWRGIVLNVRNVLQDIEGDLGGFGIDGGDYQLLAMLSEAPDRRVKLCDLASTLRLSRGGLTRRLQGVLKKGLVRRVRNESDGRSAYAELTPKGWSLLKRAAPTHVASVRERMIDRLSKEELSNLASAFEKLGPLR
jgi:DNA-binding MarR family transcriptional regulator